MKKYFLISILCLLSLVSIAQTSNTPSNFGKFQAFRNNPITFTLNFPTGYVFPTTTAETWDGETNTSQKVSTTPSVSISSNVLTVGYTAAQIRTLAGLGKFVTYVIFTDSLNVKKYVLAANITVSSASGVPSSNIINVNVPNIGDISVNLLGETGLTSNYVTLAQTAANNATTASTNAQSQASISIAKATEASTSATLAQNTAKYRTPYGNSKFLRTQPDTTYKSYYVTDSGREGYFTYNASSSAADDTSMVIVSGGRRFERVFDYIKPEYFGAIPNDLIDDYTAIQKAFNFATAKGIRIQFSPGTYLVSNTLKPKIVYGATQYNITIQGEGKGVTIIKGTTGLAGKNLLEVNPAVNSVRPDSYIEIKDITFFSGSANRIVYANNVIQFKLTNCEFRGSQIACVQIGDGDVENYFIYVERCYFNGTTINGGQNNALLRLYHARFAEVTAMVSDGGKYGMDIFQTDRTTISRCFIEGSKKYSIYIHGSAGGSHKISNNDLTPYGQFDPNATFDGTMAGLLVESVSGGSANNTLQSNFVNIPQTLPVVVLPGAITGTFTPSSTTNIVTGATSGAKAYVSGYDATANRLVLDMISGTFTDNESISQATTGATSTADSIVTNKTTGISLIGNGGYNTLLGNQVKGYAINSIYLKSDGNVISSNLFEGYNGILIDNNSQIIGNRIITTGGFAAKRVTGFEATTFANNVYNGTLVNMP